MPPAHRPVREPGTPNHGARAAAILALAFAVVGILAVVGLGVEQALKRSTLAVPGTALDAAERLSAREFSHIGPSTAVMLSGPPAAIERQGRRLERALHRHPRVRVSAPWTVPPGSRDALRPEPQSLVLVVSPKVTRSDFEWVIPFIRDRIDEHVGPPARAHVTGLMAIGGGIEEESLAAAERAERLAMPALVVILLLVFRSPIAALIPLLVGGAAVAAAKGVVRMAAEVMALDAAAVFTVSMMALALGVDYGLLMVSRFREEIDRGAGHVEAAGVARATAGRTVLFASVTLCIAMLVSAVLAPGDLLRSLVVGTLSAVIVSAGLSWVALPAILTLAGRHVDRWSLGGRGGRGLAARASRLRLRPALAVPLILLAMLVVAAPSFGLQTGAVDARQLPEDSGPRQDYEAFVDTLGPGWAAGFEVFAVSREGVATDPERLRAVARWQRRIARMDGVRQVFGPAPLAARSRDLRQTPRRLDRLQVRLRDGARQTRDLGRQLDVAGDGVRALRDGVAGGAQGARRVGAGAATTATGARRLDGGLDRAGAGTGRLAGGLDRTARGSAALRGGLERTTAGARRLSAGAGRAAGQVQGDAIPAADRLTRGLEEGSRDLDALAEPARLAEDRLASAFEQLQKMTIGRADPRYAKVVEAVGEASAAVSGEHPLTGAPVRPGYPGLPESLERASAELGTAAAGAGRLAGGLRSLASGLTRLEQGAVRLAGSLQRLQDGGAELRRALDRLLAGTDAVAGGLHDLDAGGDRVAGGAGRVAVGARRLAAGLEQGVAESRPLEEGLRSAAPVVSRRAGALRSAARRLGAATGRSPQMFDSGHAVLAAIEGGRARDRRLAQQTVSLERGGRAVRLTIIPTTGPNHPATGALYDRLREATDELGRQADMATGVAGAGAEFVVFDREVSSRFPIIVLALCLATWLALVVIFRAVLLPLVAVALNLLTVAAAFGVLAFLLDLPSKPLGDAGFIDSISAVGIFTITFGLSIDYEVFLLSRMREGWTRTGDTEQAIQYGLRTTAGVIMGAALIMTAVFVAAAMSEIASLRQLGVGLAVAVMLDATVVRLFLLPAAMRALGDWNWWLPGWLDRRLPHLVVER